jgi:hypothetical protein
MKKIAIIFLCFGLYGCSSESDGLATLKDLCEKDAGVTIYKTVEADGYYDAYTDCHHCWQELLKSKYQFVEFCDEKDRNPLAYAIPKSGCYRVLKEKRAGNSCYVDIDKKLTKKSVEPYVSFVKDHCIAVEKIDKPEARYSYHSDFKKWKSDNGNSEYTRSSVYILDQETKDILGRYINYSFNAKPGHTTARSCDSFGDDYISFLEANLLKSVFKFEEK